MNGTILFGIGVALIIGFIIGFTRLLDALCTKLGDLWGSLAFSASVLLTGVLWVIVFTGGSL